MNQITVDVTDVSPQIAHKELKDGRKFTIAPRNEMSAIKWAERENLWITIWVPQNKWRGVIYGTTLKRLLTAPFIKLPRSSEVAVLN